MSYCIYNEPSSSVEIHNLMITAIKNELQRRCYNLSVVNHLVKDKINIIFDFYLKDGMIPADFKCKIIIIVTSLKGDNLVSWLRKNKYHNLHFWYPDMFNNDRSIAHISRCAETFKLAHNQALELKPEFEYIDILIYHNEAEPFDHRLGSHFKVLSVHRKNPDSISSLKRCKSVYNLVKEDDITYVDYLFLATAIQNGKTVFSKAKLGLPCIQIEDDTSLNPYLDRTLISRQNLELLKINSGLPLKPTERFNVHVVKCDLARKVFDDVAKSYYNYLQALGFDVVRANDICPDRKNIIFGANQNVFQGAPRDSILVDMEQLHDSSPYVVGGYLNKLKQYQVWTYSMHNFHWLKAKGLENVTYVYPGYDSSLECINPVHEDIDVLFIGMLRYGYPRQRRLDILNALNKTGRQLNVVFREMVWGEERNKLIARAKIVLNIANWDKFHQFEIVRIGQLLANKKFVISEDADNTDEYKHLYGGLVICSYDKIVENVLYYLDNPHLRRDIAERGYNLFRLNPLNLPVDNMKCNLQTIPTDFNYKHYLYYNNDLNIKSDADAREHYLKEGYLEGRKYKVTLPPLFTPSKYIELNEDLPRHGIRTEFPAIQHWHNFGYSEDRSYY